MAESPMKAPHRPILLQLFDSFPLLFHNIPRKARITVAVSVRAFVP
jgi:hypothetical protein